MKIGRDAASKSEKEKVSIIIPTKDCEETISDLFDSLKKLDYPNFEIIMVDSGSDGTKEIAIQAASDAKFDFKIIYTSCKLNSARNRGIEASTADYIFFTDGDCVVKSDWIRKILFEFKKDPTIDCVGGSIITDSSTLIGRYSSEAMVPLFPRFKEEKIITKNQGTHQPFGSTRYPVGCNMAYKRKVFNHLKGFDEKWIWPWDEFELMYRMLQHGYRIKVNPDIVIYHVPCSSFSEMLRKAFGYGIGAGKHKRIHVVQNSEKTISGLFYKVIATWHHSIEVFQKTGRLSAFLYPFIDYATGIIYYIGFLKGYFGDHSY